MNAKSCSSCKSCQKTLRVLCASVLKYLFVSFVLFVVNNPYFPRNSGARLSRKLATPSLWSSV